MKNTKKKQILAFALSAAMLLSTSNIVLHAAAMKSGSYQAAESMPVSAVTPLSNTASQPNLSMQIDTEAENHLEPSEHLSQTITDSQQAMAPAEDTAALPTEVPVINTPQPTEYSSTQMPDSVAEITAGSSVTYINNLADAFLLQNDAVEIRLLTDTRLDEIIELTTGSYTLDLNGKIICSSLAGNLNISYDPKGLFCIENASLSIKDSMGNGCILSDADEQYGITCLYLGDYGKLTFSSGTIQDFSVGIKMNGRTNHTTADVSGSACITAGSGIYVTGGRLTLSDNAQVSGDSFGIYVGNFTEPPCNAHISGNPKVSGSIGLFHPGYRNSYVSISGGTFSGTEKAIETGVLINIGGPTNPAVYLYLNHCLPAYNNPNSHRYAFYNADGLIKDIHKEKTLTGTVWVSECDHSGCQISHPAGTTRHTLDIDCTACGEKSSALEACSYVWQKTGAVYTGKCVCQSLIEITLAQDHVYNGKEHMPEATVELDETVQLVPDKDYYIMYYNHKNPGTAKAVVSGMNTADPSSAYFTCETTFEISRAPVSVSGITIEDRIYNGTDKVSIHAVSLEGVIAGDDVAIDTDSLYGILSGINAGVYPSVTLVGDLKLTGVSAGSYILSEPPRIYAAAAVIHKADALAKEGALKVENNKTQDYQFDLSLLCPELPQGQSFGSSPVNYVLKEVSIDGSYYTKGASIDGTILTLPVQSAKNSIQGVIGTISIIIQSENFADIPAVITVSAFSTGGSSNSSTGGNTGSSTSGSSGSSWNPPSITTPVLPFLKKDPAKTGWYVIQKEVEKAPEKSVLEINMSGTSTLPASMLAALRNRDVTIILEWNQTFSWKLNGKDIAAGPARDMDFTVRTDTGTIPAETLHAVSGDLPHMQLCLSRDGMFRFQAILIMQTEQICWTMTGSADNTETDGAAHSAEYAGMYANLFYYNPESETLEFAEAAQIAKDGTVHLAFTHGSRYAVILSAQPMNQEQDADKNASDHISNSGNEPENSDNSQNGNKPGSTDTNILVKSVKLSKKVFTYSGRAVKPAVTATAEDDSLIPAEYYKVSYKNNKTTGIAQAFVTFKDKYISHGTVELTFTIRPAKPSITKVLPAPHAFSVKWKKTAQTDGYQIQYAANAAFSGKHTHSVFVKKNAAAKKVIQNLKAEKNYYIHIRAYKTAAYAGKSKKIYSPWSRTVRTGKIPAKTSGR